ncbi:hypothetical protein PN450_06060 [Dolichospermum lemmermannii CS-548]|nr:hypothetical protein [Dolichospermum lemmermannii]MDB9436378.1 hypothetical protein [Dolichospermum lemmermannii CS-548]
MSVVSGQWSVVILNMVGTWTFAKLQKTWICSSRGLAIGVNLT